jgi:hypothetical protein
MSPPKPEELARERIDAALHDAGWIVQDYLQMNVHAARGVAVREFRLPKSEGGLGREGRAARELLERRGLTDAEIHNAQQILDVIGKIAPAPAPARDIAAEEEAEKAMWAWYLQWSAIARVAVKERKLLKLMGYRKTATGQVVEPEVPEDGEEEEEDDDEDVVDPEPSDPAPEEPEPAPI